MTFVVGALTSILAGFIGMMVAVYANARTAVSAKKEGEAGWTASFNAAFRAGGVMGFSLCAISMVVLYVLAVLYRSHFSVEDKGTIYINYKMLFECLAVLPPALAPAPRPAPFLGALLLGWPARSETSPPPRLGRAPGARCAERRCVIRLPAGLRPRRLRHCHVWPRRRRHLHQGGRRGRRPLWQGHRRG